MRRSSTIFVVLVLICVCLALMPTKTQASQITASGTYGDNLIWTFDDTGTLTISGVGAMRDCGEETDYTDEGPAGSWWGNPPWSRFYSSIVRIVIEQGVTHIGDYAFVYVTYNFLEQDFMFSSYDKLISVEIPDSVTSIGASAFYNCTSLSSVTYCGNDDKWSNIEIGSGNAALVNATRYHNHNYIAATCTIPKTCSACGATEGEALGHSWVAAAGTTPKTCSVCGEESWWANDPHEHSYTVVGVYILPLGPNNMIMHEYACSICGDSYTSEHHMWRNATCTEPATCYGYGYGCFATSGKALGHSWVTTTKLPTFTNRGEQVSTCSHCGEQKIELTPAKFFGTSINLGNTLDMYFGFYTGLVDEGGKVVFVREYADGTTETTEAPITSFKKNNSVYDITYNGLAAKEMCDTIHVSVYNSEGALVGEHSDSIRSYILRQLREKEHEQAFRTLCIDLLNYGAAAQEAFGYNPDDLANNNLTIWELAEGTQKAEAYTDKQVVIENAASFYGTSYILETNISMAMAVRADRIGAGCYALVSYTDHTGDQKSNIRLEGTKNYSVYEFILNEIVVADGRCLLTVEFYKADGTKVLTVQDSMESYTARNVADYPWLEKMLTFSDSAYKYLHRNDDEIDNDDAVELDVDLLQSEKYVAYELIGDNVLMEYTIDSSCWIEDNVMIFDTGGYYYYAEPSTAGTNPVQYGGKTYYGGDGGFGGYWLVVKGNTLEAYDEWDAWLYTDSQSKATYVMQRNGDLRLIKGDADQYPYLWTSQTS